MDNEYYQKKLLGNMIISTHDHMKMDGLDMGLVERLCPKFPQFEERLRKGESGSMSHKLLMEMYNQMLRIKKLYFPNMIW